jgi:hypothetical protein
VERLELLRAQGPSPSAFGFRDDYRPQDVSTAAATVRT